MDDWWALFWVGLGFGMGFLCAPFVQHWWMLRQAVRGKAEESGFELEEHEDGSMGVRLSAIDPPTYVFSKETVARARRNLQRRRQRFTE